MKDRYVYNCECSLGVGTCCDCSQNDWDGLCTMTSAANRSLAFRTKMLDAYRRIVAAAVTFCGNNTNMLITTPPDVNLPGVLPTLKPVIIDNQTVHVPRGRVQAEYVRPCACDSAPYAIRSFLPARSVSTVGGVLCYSCSFSTKKTG